MKTTDTERLAMLEQALGNMPDMAITYNLEDGEEDDIGLIPAGWNIRIPQGCADAPVTLNAPTFVGVVDALIAWHDGVLAGAQKGAA